MQLFIILTLGVMLTVYIFNITIAIEIIGLQGINVRKNKEESKTKDDETKNL